METTAPKTFWKTIFYAGITAGVLDALAASIMFYSMTGRSADLVWRFVATGIFGPSAMAGGIPMVIAGLIFHFAIAMIWTIIFFVVFPKLRAYSKYWFLIGAIYGLIVWAAMNLIVVPLSATPKSSLQWEGAIRNMIVLILCVGLPIAWYARRHYRHS